MRRGRSVTLDYKDSYGGVRGEFAKLTKNKPKFSSIQTGNERGRVLCFPTCLFKIRSLTLI